MRKLLWLIVCLMTMVLASCGSTYSVTASYDVCYPDGTKSYEFNKTYKNSTEPTVTCFSIGGTNYLSIHSAMDEISKNPKGRIIISTTAPIRLTSCTVENIKKRRYLNDKRRKGDDIYMDDILSHSGW